MSFDELLYRLAVALGIGLLTGLERGWKTRDVTPGSRAAGVRTLALCGLAGGITAALGVATGSAEGAALVFGFGFVAYAAVMTVFQREANRASGSYSATTMIAAMLTYLLGAYAVWGDMRIAAATAVAATGILAAREQMHRWVARLTWEELRSALVLLAMSLIVLPLLPDATMGPGINPREVWLIAIVLAGVSFVGYAAVKVFGAQRGVLLAAFAGGLVSSTAVTLSNARRAAAGEGAPSLLAAGVAAASAVSFLRVIAIVAALAPALLDVVGPALAAATLVALSYAAVTYRWRATIDAGGSVPADFKNPFSFWPVVGFALFLAVVIVLGRLLSETFGGRGALLGALALGLADIDAVTVSVARLVPSPLSLSAAGLAILAAVASNTLAKLAVGVVLGRGRFAAEIAVMTAGCWAAALLVLWAKGG